MKYSLYNLAYEQGRVATSLPFETLRQIKFDSFLFGGFGYKPSDQGPGGRILPQLLTLIYGFTCSSSFLALLTDLSEAREVCFRLVCLAFLM